MRDAFDPDLILWSHWLLRDLESAFLEKRSRSYDDSGTIKIEQYGGLALWSFIYDV